MVDVLCRDKAPLSNLPVSWILCISVPTLLRVRVCRHGGNNAMHYVFMLTERRAGRNFLHLKRLDASPVKVRKRTYQTLKNTATSHESNSLGQKNQTPNERMWVQYTTFFLSFGVWFFCYVQYFEIMLYVHLKCSLKCSLHEMKRNFIWNHLRWNETSNYSIETKLLYMTWNETFLFEVSNFKQKWNEKRKTPY